jgi:hypothetical protein
MYYYELVTGMEKDIHVSHKGRALLQIGKKGRASVGQGKLYACQRLFHTLDTKLMLPLGLIPIITFAVLCFL